MFTTLKFMTDDPIYDTEKPYEMFGLTEIPENERSNCQYMTIDGIPLLDVRNSNEHFSLKDQGFTFVHHKSKCPLSAEDFEKPGDTLSPNVDAYLKETIDFVKKELGALDVICFDWRFRRSNIDLDRKIKRNDARPLRQTALPAGLTLHCDYSHSAGRERLQMHLSEEELFGFREGKQRIRILNAWRPFDTVDTAPLVISDRRSVKPADLIGVDKIQRGMIEEAYYVKYRDYHKWWFLSHQTTEDLALFTTWDSAKDPEHEIADWAPHGAACHFPEGKKPRESLEVRLIVLYPLDKSDVDSD